MRRQLQEQVLRPGEHLLHARVAAVDLVDDDDRPEAELERLLQHEARLRHRPLDGVHQQQAAVGHVQHALDLAAEVGVAGRVDDVDLDAAIHDRRVLGQDRDAALALQVVRVHDQLADLLVLAEDVALLEQAVHQRRLAMVDVRDDRHVADVLTHVACRSGARLTLNALCLLYLLHECLSSLLSHTRTRRAPVITLALSAPCRSCRSMPIMPDTPEGRPRGRPRPKRRCVARVPPPRGRTLP